MADIYKPGNKVQASGIYRVVHDPRHAEDHEVTAVAGEPFPACNRCGLHPRFHLVRAAHYLATHEEFKRK